MMNSVAFLTFMMLRIGLESSPIEGSFYVTKSPPFIDMWDSWSFAEDSTFSTDSSDPHFSYRNSDPD